MYLPIRPLLTSLATCAVLSSTAIGQDRVGDDRHKYQTPPLVACSDAAGFTGVFIGEDQCFLVSGEARLAVGYDSYAGLLARHSEIGRVSAVLGTDLGPVFGVLALRNQGTLPDQFAGISEGVSLYEAYLAVGEDLRLTVGRAPSIIKTDDSRALDWLGRDNSYAVFFPIENDGSVPLTANSVQLSARLSDEFQVGVAWEDGVTGNFWYPELTQPRVVASARYDDGQTQANVLVGRFQASSDAGSGLYGNGDSFAARATVNSLLTDTFRLLLGGSFGSDQSIGGMVSAQVQLGPLEVAGTYQKVGGYAWSGQPILLSGSLTAEISPALSIRVGALTTRGEYDNSRQIGMGSIFEVWENAALEFEIGRYQSDWSSFNYARGSLDWHINESAKVRASGTVTGEGAYKIESEVVTSFR